MNNYSSCTFTSLAMGMDDMALNRKDAIPFIILISIFVFGLLLFKKFVKIPKRLIVSAFISYALMLFIILFFYLGRKCFGETFRSNILVEIVAFSCVFVILPNLLIFNIMEELFSLQVYKAPVFFQTMLYLITFFMNILYIYWIIKLISFIKHKISAKKSQGEQSV